MASPTDVVILFGGDGSEHRVSVASAQNVSSLLPEARLWYWTRSGAVVDVFRDELASFERPFETDFAPRPLQEWSSLDHALAAPAASDAVFFLALHGGSGEDGTVQQRLEDAGIPFTGSGAEASRLAFDKARARELVAEQGIRVAEAYLVGADGASHERLAALFERHDKIVVKPAADGSSHGVRFIADERQLNETIAYLRTTSVPHLAEAFIEGRELTVGVIDDDGEQAPATQPSPFLRALPCSEVRLDPGRSFDFEGKYLGKGTVELTPAPIDAELAGIVQDVALAAHRAAGCAGYSRTDVIVSDDGPVFLEINTLPGLTAASFIPQQLEAAGIPMARFLDRQLALARRRG